jgi:hypothetical protein
MAITLQQSVQSPHRRWPDEVMDASPAPPIAYNLGEMTAKVRRSGPKARWRRQSASKVPGLSIPGLFTLSPMPCIKAMVIWPLLA